MQEPTRAKPQPTFNPKDYQNHRISLEEVLEIKQAFDLFDENGEGQFDSEELRRSLVAFGFQEKNQALGAAIYQISERYEHAVYIDFARFFQLVTSYSADSDNYLGLNFIFRRLDLEKTGFVSLKNLRRVVKELGEDIDDGELQRMIEQADLDNDGLVSWEEFYAIMTKKV